jgi:hypothetical protein
MRVCIVGASGKLGQYMVQHALDRDYEVVGVCREQSVAQLDAFKERITFIPGATDDRDVIKQAVAGCHGVLVVLVPRGVHNYSSGTAQAVLDHAQPGALSLFRCDSRWRCGAQARFEWRRSSLRGLAALLALPRLLQGAECAAEEDERLIRGSGAYGADSADDDRVVAGGVLGDDLALEAGERAGDQWHSASAVVPVEAGEPIGAGRSGADREPLVLSAQHVDTEVPGPPHPGPRERAA